MDELGRMEIVEEEAVDNNDEEEKNETHSVVHNSEISNSTIIKEVDKYSTVVTQ